MKKIISIMLVLVLAATMMIACNKEKEKPDVEPKTTEVAPPENDPEPTEEPEPVTPEPAVWTVGGELNEEKMNIFNKATEELLGVDYTPVVYLGNKVDKDQTDHFYFCTASVVIPDSVPYPAVVMVSENSEAEAPTVTIINIDLNQTPALDYWASSNAQDTNLMINWKLNEELPATEEDKAFVEKALNGYSASIYDVVLHLADNEEDNLSCYLCRAYVDGQEEATEHFVLMFIEAGEGDALRVKKVSTVNYDRLLSGINR